MRIRFILRINDFDFNFQCHYLNFLINTLCRKCDSKFERSKISKSSSILFLPSNLLKACHVNINVCSQPTCRSSHMSTYLETIIFFLNFLNNIIFSGLCGFVFDVESFIIYSNIIILHLFITGRKESDFQQT